MVTGSVYDRVSAALEEYLRSLGMGVQSGPVRAMAELIRGIVWTGSVQLSNAARLRVSRSRPLQRVVERLSHHLSDRRWDHREWAAGILAEQVRHLEDDTLIPIDGTELAKPYARHMQYQCTVRDASRPGDPLVQGYWCWGAYSWDSEARVLCPLMLRPYSQKEPRFISENDRWRKYGWTLREATGGKGIWLSDRGGDRPEILSAWLRCQPRWIIRLRGDRGLIGPDGSRRSARDWAQWALSHRDERGRAVTLKVRLPPDEVPQPENPPTLWLVVPTYTFSDGECWLLLTCGLIDQHTGPRQVRYDYALRWRAEDAKRFLGQLWHVERFLTRSFLALERTLWCVTAAGGFLAMLQRDYPTLADHLHKEVLYWDKSFELPIYRLAHGLRTLAARHGVAAMPVNA